MMMMMIIIVAFSVCSFAAKWPKVNAACKLSHLGWLVLDLNQEFASFRQFNEDKVPVHLLVLRS